MRIRGHVARPIIVGLFVLGFLAVAGLPSSPATAGGGPDCRAPKDRLVVHEWGTFTSVTGSDGVDLDWRPLSGTSDLPRFVYSLDAEGAVVGGLRGTQIQRITRREIPDPVPRKQAMVARVRMETPVIYFYADQETDVSVEVGFPQGEVTEWYPQAAKVGHGIDWGKFKVLPGAAPELPVESGKSHYYPARRTDAAPVRVCGQGGNEFEKFLFYRGVGTFDLPISAELEGDTVRVSPTGRGEVSRVFLFENRDGKITYRSFDRLATSVTAERPLREATVSEVERQLETALVTAGLYRKEARAMLETWHDQWFEEGLRCFYIVPRTLTDEVLPLEISPTPAELVRVLVGRLEIITPEMERDVLRLVEKLDDDVFEAREEASRKLGRYGRFAEPILKRALEQSSDPELRHRAQRLLRAFGGGA